jgi:hypothetical protein
MRVAGRRSVVVSQRECLRESVCDLLADRGRDSNPKPAFYMDIFPLYIRALVTFFKDRPRAIIGLPQGRNGHVRFMSYR